MVPYYLISIEYVLALFRTRNVETIIRGINYLQPLLQTLRAKVVFAYVNCRCLYFNQKHHYFTQGFSDQMRPELNNVLQSISTNGYSVYSLIDDILAPCNSEDQRVRLLQEGMERDAADLCARLLCHITSGPEMVLKFGRVQCACSRLCSSAHNMY